MGLQNNIKPVSNVDIFGRKVFFIAPNSTFINGETMERLCEMGFETYIINEDATPIKDKISAIARLFPECIIYFNVDSKVGGAKWEALIREVKQEHEGLLVGAVYKARTEGNDIDRERDYRVNAGVIPLKNGDNVAEIRKVIEEHSAKGRRNNIRVNADESSTVSMTVGSKSYTAKVEDINLTHFRCTFSEDFGMKIFDKVRDAKVVFNGYTIQSDAVLIMRRVKEGVHGYIFMFIHDRPNDAPDLEAKIAWQLNSKIYRILTNKMNETIRSACN